MEYDPLAAIQAERAHASTWVAPARPAEPVNERDQAVSQLVDIRRRMAALKAEERRLASKVLSLVPVGTEHAPIGGVAVTVTQPTKFSEARAKELLTPDVLKAISITVTEIDPALAAQYLPGAAFEACKAPYGTPRITFGRGE